MRKIWGYLKNRSAVATYAVLTVALLGMGLLLWSSTATAGYHTEDTPMAQLAKEPSLPLRDVIVEEGVRQVVMAKYYPEKYFDYIVAHADDYQDVCQGGYNDGSDEEQCKCEHRLGLVGRLSRAMV